MASQALLNKVKTSLTLDRVGDLLEKKMTLKEAAKKAVQEQNYKMFAQVVEQLRSMGFNYEDAASFFKKTCSLDKEEFELFCYGADSVVY